LNVELRGSEGPTHARIGARRCPDFPRPRRVPRCRPHRPSRAPVIGRPRPSRSRPLRWPGGPPGSRRGPAPLRAGRRAPRATRSASRGGPPASPTRRWMPRAQPSSRGVRPESWTLVTYTCHATNLRNGRQNRKVTRGQEILLHCSNLQPVQHCRVTRIAPLVLKQRVNVEKGQSGVVARARGTDPFL
jgi:hypothetical protein